MAAEFTRKLESLKQKYETEIADLKKLHLKETFNTKRLRNPWKNRWVRKGMSENISPDGLTINDEWKYFFSKLPFRISGGCRKEDDYPGAIVYYFEVARISSFNAQSTFYVGLSNGNISDDGQLITENRNYFYFGNGDDHCTLDENEHIFEWQDWTMQPEWNGDGDGDVIGCGLVLNPNNQLAIFFTVNGILMGKQIQINKPLSNYLYPIVIMDAYANMPLQTNFGDDPAKKPFKYDIGKCPGLGLD